MTIHVKIAVICHIDQSICIRNCMVSDLHCIVFCQSICYLNMYSSRISLITIRAVQFKCNMIICGFFYLPHSLVIKIHSAVEIIAIIILFKLIGHSVQFKGCSSDTVCTSPDNCTEEQISFFISCCLIISKHNITRLAFFVRYDHLYQRCTVIGYCNLHSVFICERI